MKSRPARFLYARARPAESDWMSHWFAANRPGQWLRVESLEEVRESLWSDTAPEWLVLAPQQLDGNCLEVVDALRRAELPVAVVVLSESGNVLQVSEAYQAGADECLPDRPASANRVEEVLREARLRCERRRSSHEMSRNSPGRGLCAGECRDGGDNNTLTDLLIESLPGLFILMDEDMRCLRWNRNLEEQLGLTSRELHLGKLMPFVVGEDQQRVRAAFQTVLADGAATIEARIKTACGSLRYTFFNGRRLTVKGRRQVLCVGLDTTEYKELAEQVLRSQRLESVALLAKGIAHDLGNVLTPIHMTPEMVMSLTENKKIGALMDILGQQVRRATEVVHQLASLGDGIKGGSFSVEVLSLVRELRRILEATLPGDIRLVIEANENRKHFILGDPNQLHHALVCLCSRARQAMPQGGVLKLGIEEVFIDEGVASMADGAKSGQHVVLTLADTGTPLERSTVAALNAASGATVTTVGGAGLDLVAVAGIVREHGGFLRVESDATAGGTRFLIHLPVIESAGEATAGGADAGLKGHGELVLVVDDEPTFRAVSRQILQRHGYRVLEAEDGAMGLSVCAEHAAELRAVIIDLKMPCMDGRLMLHAIQNLKIGARSILVSGEVLAEREMRQLTGLADRMLRKPFSTNTLLRALHDVLEPAAA